MRYIFPKLFLRTESNNIRFWEIWVVGDKSGNAFIYKKYGIKGGKIITPSPQIIKKTIGKKSSYDRALLIASTKWKNRMRKGYKNTEPDIKFLKKYSKKTNKNIIPMKAYNLANHTVIFPAYIQPKIDGYRALLHNNNGTYEFLSNTQREYSHLDHIKAELTKIKELNNSDFYLDGELYIEDEHVNVLRSILSSKKLNNEQEKLSKKIKYYVFDMFELNEMNLNYAQRYKILNKIFNKKFNKLVLTPTFVVNNKNQIDEAFNKFISQGFEGIIVRNSRGLYKLRGKSVNVLKSKDIKKDNFIIVGFKEATGNNKGTVIWEIRCKNDPRKTFWARPMGTRNDRKKMYKNGEKFIGKKVTVKYFEINKNGCVSKNPVAFF